jgi:hypothetical protein
VSCFISQHCQPQFVSVRHGLLVSLPFSSKASFDILAFHLSKQYQAAAQVPNVPVQFFVSKEILKG